MTALPLFDGTQACRRPSPAEAAGFDGAWGRDTGPAKARCAGSCPFLDGCRAYALQADVHGVWGGLDDDDRDRLRSSTGLPAPPPASEVLDLLVRQWRVTSEGSGSGVAAAAKGADRLRRVA